LLTYRRAKILSRTIESILAQTHRNFELIVNDDNSPDETEQVVGKYAAIDQRVRYCKNSQNLRYAGNQNAALARSRFDLVAILHDGDVYRHDLIEKWSKAMTERPSAAIVFNALEEMGEDGNVTRIHTHDYPELIPGRRLLTEMLKRPDSPIFGIVMVRKCHVASVGEFDTRLPTLADIDMWMRLLTRFDAAYIKEPLIRIAGREKNHHNQIGNWKVRMEHEAIHSMNFARASAAVPPITGCARSEVRQMLWGQRLYWLAWCIKRGRVSRFIEGVRYCFKNLDVLAPCKGVSV
jgi:glycosyltransferase involved in cell wall biosynthesis